MVDGNAHDPETHPAYQQHDGLTARPGPMLQNKKHDHAIMTRVMKPAAAKPVVSKSAFKARALAYFRQVERTGKELIISDNGKPVLKVVPYSSDPAEALKALRGSVRRYEDLTEPVGLEDWEALR
jgi:prevent-host-death family protein